jgi:hypothetical protein
MLQAAETRRIPDVPICRIVKIRIKLSLMQALPAAGAPIFVVAATMHR